MAAVGSAYAHLCDEDIERELLGCLLVDIELCCAVKHLVRVDDFCLYHHRILSQEIVHSGAIPFYSISEKLVSQPLICEVGGERFIRELAVFVENYAEGLTYAHRVARLGRQRRILRVAESMAKAAIRGDLKGLSTQINRKLKFALFTPANLKGVGDQMPLPGLLSDVLDQQVP